jgi:pimeloyl-ACP methyl ester carboxylesterase
MPTVFANGVNLYYESDGAGVPILGIHGTPSSALLWADAAKDLARHGRCIIYDRRGYSRSERPQPFVAVDLSDHVEDAAALLDALSASPAAVIGRSTGGLIALDLARRFPDKVCALVLLEPAVFTLDPRAAAWAARLRDEVLRAATQDPSSAAEVVCREALGDELWESLPPEVRETFTGASPAVLAEIRGRGLDLSDEPASFGTADLAGIAQPTLIVSAEDSPEALRLVCDRLAEALPDPLSARATGGHLIDPAHPEVLSFIERVTRPVAGA